MRTKAIRGLLAAAMAASTVMAVGVGVASPASAATCSTWQYKVKSKVVARPETTNDAGGKKRTLYTGYRLNAHTTTDFIGWAYDDVDELYVTVMRRGDVYNTDGTRIADEWYVRKDKLDYVTCW
jgi:hypothetical protein